MRPVLLSAILALSLIGAACNKSSPAGPSETPQTQTQQSRIISLSGDLNFGDVAVGSNADRTMTITNSGTAALEVTGLTSPHAGTTFAANWTQGVIAPGGSQSVTIRCSPPEAQYYAGVLRVNGNQTSGNNGINIACLGIDTSPLFVRSGVGDTVFDAPSKIQRIHVVATYTGNSQNFVLWVGQPGTACGVVISGSCSLLVNELMGRFWDQTRYEATLSTGGRTVMTIESSSGVSWTITEVR